jgi:hypothetical protein
MSALLAVVGHSAGDDLTRALELIEREHPEHLALEASARARPAAAGPPFAVRRRSAGGRRAPSRAEGVPVVTSAPAVIDHSRSKAPTRAVAALTRPWSSLTPVSAPLMTSNELDLRRRTAHREDVAAARRAVGRHRARSHGRRHRAAEAYMSSPANERTRAVVKALGLSQSTADRNRARRRVAQARAAGLLPNAGGTRVRRSGCRSILAESPTRNVEPSRAKLPCDGGASMDGEQRRNEVRGYYLMCPTCEAKRGIGAFETLPLGEMPAKLGVGERFTCGALEIPDVMQALAFGGGLAAAITRTQHDFLVRDGVLAVLNRPATGPDDILMPFVGSTEITGHADLVPGVLTRVVFVAPLAEIYGVSLQLSGGGRADGADSLHHIEAVEVLPTGFVLLSSLLPGALPPDDPVQVRWNAYGRDASAAPWPVWRELIANALRHLLEQRWHLAALEAVFALESAIDTAMTADLLGAGVAAKDIKARLRADELSTTIIDLRTGRGEAVVARTVKRRVRPLVELRNAIAHGVRSPSSVSEQDARATVSASLTALWDWLPECRLLLLLPRRSSVSVMQSSTVGGAAVRRTMETHDEPPADAPPEQPADNTAEP